MSTGEAWACYVLVPHLGWVVDTGVGGTFDFAVEQCQEWPSAEALDAELKATELKDVVHTYVAVRVR